ncbi:pilus assembly FimT family protein [Rosistilla oblonga]|uniref:pilus assembly FimT family protein n=1 Tax=Rosistilla oblonga TaxID=2527990 RepID=UPI003A96D69C
MIRFDLKRSDQGFTLVELLVVIGVLSILTAVTLPTFRDVITDARASESIRNVRAFIETARTMAATTGRSHAIVFERDGANFAEERGSVTLLRIVSAAPDYTGDFEKAACFLYHESATAAPLSGLTLAPNAAVFDPSECVSLVKSASVANGPVRVGDVLVLSGRRLVITAIGMCDNTDPPAVDFSDPLPNSWVKVYFDPRGATGTGNVDTPDFPALSLSGTGTNVDSTPRQFRIERKTLRGGGKTMRLPRNSAIDLYYSGIGLASTQFSPASISAAQMNSSAVVDYGPVSIVFNPTGAVERAYVGTLVADTPSPNFTWAPTTLQPYSSIFILVGRTANVRPDQIDTASSTLVDIGEDERSNILDVESGWVVINPFNGQVRTADVASVTGPFPYDFTTSMALAQRLAIESN